MVDNTRAFRQKRLEHYRMLNRISAARRQERTRMRERPTVLDYLDGQEAEWYVRLTLLIEALYGKKRRSIRQMPRCIPLALNRAIRRSLEAAVEARYALWREARRRAEQEGVDWLPPELEAA
jgi:hypothetical protein